MTQSRVKLKPRGKPRNRPLTMKQMAFCVYYVSASVNLNATEAARRAGYKGNDNTLGTVGFQNMLKPAIRGEIDRRMAIALSGAEITVENTLKRLTMLGKMAQETGQYASAVRCAELQGKYLNMWTDKIEHVQDVEDISIEELVRLIREIAESGDVDLRKLMSESEAEDVSPTLCPGSKKPH
ncbi:MAG: terminase small subunit [Gammaproteobacteria bacterium]|nr:terminase small subunit [Gammaproteobacteria bacterium]